MKVRPILFGYSWVGILNFILIQWFFIRICVGADENRNITMVYTIGLIVPLTGWWNDFLWIYAMNRKSRRLQIGYNRQQKPAANKR